MLELKFTAKFKKDYKKAKKRGKDLKKLEKILEKLVCREELPKSACDHSLGGVYRGHGECHIEPDWLLIYRINVSLEQMAMMYRINEDEFVLVATRLGCHGDLLRM